MDGRGNGTDLRWFRQAVGGAARRVTPARRVGQRVGPVAIVLVAASLGAACSGGSSAGGLPPVTSGTTSATASTTPGHPTPPTPLGYSPSDPARIGAWLEMAPFTPKTAQETAVLKTWTAFQHLMVQSVNQQNVDRKTLEALTTGNWQRRAVNGVGKRQQDGQYTVGRVIVQVRGIQVGAGTALVDYCQDDQSYQVDMHGKALGQPPGVALVQDRLLLVNGRWLLSDQPKSVPRGCSLPMASQ